MTNEREVRDDPVEENTRVRDENVPTGLMIL